MSYLGGIARPVRRLHARGWNVATIARLYDVTHMAVEVILGLRPPRPPSPRGPRHG